MTSLYFIQYILVLLLVNLKFALPTNVEYDNSREDCCDFKDEVYICEDCTNFPRIDPNAVHVEILNSHFCDIPEESFPPEVESITMRDCHIQTIKKCAFEKLDQLETIALDSVTISKIENSAFHDLEFTDVKMSAPTERSVLRFTSCAIGEIEEGAFDRIKNVNDILFEDTTIGSCDDHSFDEVTMGTQLGTVSLRSVTVGDGDEFLNMDDIFNVHEVNIEDLVQKTLSRSLIGGSHPVRHSMSSSTFSEIDEDLSEDNYEQMEIMWSDINVHCGEDIEWLITDKTSVPPEMLNSLVCTGPGDLNGQKVADLEEADWAEAVSSSDLSVVVIIAIVIGVLILLLVLIAFVVYCVRKNRPPAPIVTPTVPIAVVIANEKKTEGDDAPPSYDNVVAGQYNHAYANPTRPITYDNITEKKSHHSYDNHSAPKYDNPMGAQCHPMAMPGTAQMYDNPTAPGMNPGYVPEAPSYETIDGNQYVTVTIPVPSAPHVEYDNGTATMHTRPNTDRAYDNTERAYDNTERAYDNTERASDNTERAYDNNDTH